MIRSLLWKEWIEQRWKLAFGSVILMGAVAIGLQTRMMPDQLTLVITMLLGSFALPILSAMGVVAADRHQGGLRYLLALPVNPWIVLAVKTGTGAMVCVLPIAGTAAVACLMAGGREVAASEIIIIHIGTACTALAVFVWTLSLSIRQPTEAQVGLIGVLVVIAWLFSPVLVEMLRWHGLSENWWAIIPLGFLDALDRDKGRGWQMARVALVQTPVAALLWCWAAARISRCARV